MYDHRWRSNWNGLIIALVLGLVLVQLATLTEANAQTVPTSTPDAEGVIYVEVMPNDSLWGIASNSGITLQELLAYNELTENTIIQPGQLLIIGYGTPPPTPTVELPTPTATATRPPPTQTATALPLPRTAICLVAYDDLNRDGIMDRGEPLKAAVAFTIFNEESVVGNYITDGESEPYCLEGLAPGEYKITRSLNRDEILTTDGDWALTLASGSILDLEFGSFVGADVASVDADDTASPGPTLGPASSEATPDIAEPIASEPDLTSTILIGLAILILVMLGVGLLLSFRRR
jgi:LysM repeat protein